VKMMRLAIRAMKSIWVREAKNSLKESASFSDLQPVFYE
jgi:hypothetical protein